MATERNQRRATGASQSGAALTRAPPPAGRQPQPAGGVTRNDQLEMCEGGGIIGVVGHTSPATWAL
eukprot:1935541-Pyramimonas_sp.AAC.1